MPNVRDQRMMLTVSSDAFAAVAGGSAEVAAIAKKYHRDGQEEVAKALNATHQILQDLKI